MCPKFLLFLPSNCKQIYIQFLSYTVPVMEGLYSWLISNLLSVGKQGLADAWWPTSWPLASACSSPTVGGEMQWHQLNTDAFVAQLGDILWYRVQYWINFLCSPLLQHYRTIQTILMIFITALCFTLPLKSIISTNPHLSATVEVDALWCTTNRGLAYLSGSSISYRAA